MKHARPSWCEPTVVASRSTTVLADDAGTRIQRPVYDPFDVNAGREVVNVRAVAAAGGSTRVVGVLGAAPSRVRAGVDAVVAVIGVLVLRMAWFLAPPLLGALADALATLLGMG